MLSVALQAVLDASIHRRQLDIVSKVLNSRVNRSTDRGPVNFPEESPTPIPNCTTSLLRMDNTIFDREESSFITGKPYCAFATFDSAASRGGIMGHHR